MLNAALCNCSSVDSYGCVDIFQGSQENLTDFEKERNKKKRISGRFLRKKHKVSCDQFLNNNSSVQFCLSAILVYRLWSRSLLCLGFL